MFHLKQLKMKQLKKRLKMKIIDPNKKKKKVRVQFL